MSKKLLKTSIDVGAQNCHENINYGAFTGSVNSKMLKVLELNMLLLVILKIDN